MEDLLVIKQDNKIYTVRLLFDGYTYGSNNQLIWDEPFVGVEFFDNSLPEYKENFTNFGRFLTRFNVKDVLSHEGPLNLCYGTDCWIIKESNLSLVKSFIEGD